MQIKRFEAKNMTDALRQIKRELGPEAVILSAKDLRRENRLLGISRKIGVEVTAAVDEDHLGNMASRRSTGLSSRYGSENDGPVGRSESLRKSQDKVSTVTDRVSLKGMATRLGALSQLSGLSRKGPGEPAAIREDDGPERRMIDKDAGHFSMGRYLQKNGLSIGNLAFAPDAPTLIALVGNAGVGKTSTLGKLAAHFTHTEKATVGILSLDRNRLGGHAQLQCYADSMRLPLIGPQNARDLNKAREKLKHCRVILIDTPAVNPQDDHRLSDIRSQMQVLGDVKTLLVVSAENREEDLNDIGDRYAALNPIGAIITKTDLTRSYTGLVNFLCRKRLAVFFYSTGTHIAFDLKTASLERLATHFLTRETDRHVGANENAPLAPEAAVHRTTSDGAYLANKNSDIFHRPGCKWIRLINRENIVEFDSFAEALNNRFKPCRYCNPQHLSITGILSRERAAL